MSNIVLVENPPLLKQSTPWKKVAIYDTRDLLHKKFDK